MKQLIRAIVGVDSDIAMDTESILLDYHNCEAASTVGSLCACCDTTPHTDTVWSLWVGYQVFSATPF